MSAEIEVNLIRSFNLCLCGALGLVRANQDFMIDFRHFRNQFVSIYILILLPNLHVIHFNGIYHLFPTVSVWRITVIILPKVLLSFMKEIFHGNLEYGIVKKGNDPSLC